MTILKRLRRGSQTVETVSTPPDESAAVFSEKNEKNRQQGEANDVTESDKNENDSPATTPSSLEANGARPPIFDSTFKEIICIFLLALSPVLEALTTGALLVALDKIGHSYKIEGGQLSWTLSAFSLGTGSIHWTLLSLSRLRWLGSIQGGTLNLLSGLLLA